MTPRRLVEVLLGLQETAFTTPKTLKVRVSSGAVEELPVGGSYYVDEGNTMRLSYFVKLPPDDVFVNFVRSSVHLTRAVDQELDDLSYAGSSYNQQGPQRIMARFGPKFDFHQVYDYQWLLDQADE